ncbi:hypothetical protein SteCoe_9632 [Stentor coeruleus]|uniref:Coiled-coil domain-containing protein 112 n=1 Tax=Stentor coeruleus TaxID=5963 RepID=A0A1R2CHE4_9CILI|nr:hypothetical protein SteCoe_9632 [Stentor coeruleus]
MEGKDFIKTSLKIKKEHDLLSKDKERLFVTVKPLLREEIADIDETDKELIQKYDSISRVFFSGLSRIKKQVGEVSKKLKTFVESTKSQGISSDYDYTVSTLQKAADLVNKEILEFKDKSRSEYEELMQSEKILQNELDYYSTKFSQWENEVPKSTKPTIKSIIDPQGLPPLKQELMNIDKEIQETGGQYLTWDEIDHTEFLRLWHKHKTKATPAFIQAAANALPLHDIEDIREHVVKYENWVCLNEKKKEILNKWREEKTKMKSTDDVEEVQIIKTKPRPQSAVQAKEKLEDWRNKREKAKEEDQKQKKLEELRKKEEELRKKNELEDKRQMVLEYKEKKEFEKAKSKLISDYVKRKSAVELSDEDKLRLKEREDRLVEQKRMRTLANMRAQEDKVKQETLSKLKNQAQWSHVDSKLTQETVSFAKRKEAIENDTSKSRPNTFGGMLVHRPTRAIPTWRAGL